VKDYNKLCLAVGKEVKTDRMVEGQVAVLFDPFVFIA